MAQLGQRKVWPQSAQSRRRRTRAGSGGSGLVAGGQVCLQGVGSGCGEGSLGTALLEIDHFHRRQRAGQTRPVRFS